MAAPFDVDGLTPTAPPQPVLDSVATTLSAGYAAFAVSANGTLAYVPSDVVLPVTELVWIDRAGQATPPFAPSAAYVTARIAPDDTRLAVTINERGYATLSVYDLSRNILTPISRREATTRAATWSHDSRTLYYAVENPVFDIFRRSADAGEPEAQVLSSGSDKLPSGVAPDGRALLFADISFSSDTGGAFRVARVSLDSDGSVDTVITIDGSAADATVSPDGRWLLYMSTESGRAEVYLRSYPDVRRVRHQLSSAGGTSPRWTRGGREVVYAEGRRIMSVAVNGGTSAPPAAVQLFAAPPALRFLDASPDGSRFLFARRPVAQGSDMGADVPRIVVVVNWLATLRQRFSGR
jgi:eukaryotic-like serine/threonine-protein kinase